MSLDKLVEQPSLPYERVMIVRGGNALADYLQKLVQAIQGSLSYDERKAINNVLSIVNAGVLNFSVPDSNGVYPTNAQRLYISANTLLHQYYDGTVWQTISSVTLAGLFTIADAKLNSPSQIYLLNHDSFAGFVANKHIDHSGVSVSTVAPLSGGGDLTASRALSLSIFSTDLGVDGSSQLYIKDGGIDHNATTNYDANKHINHTGVSITAGDGLSGGGTIAATRTLTNADKGSSARTAHESAYDHVTLHTVSELYFANMVGGVYPDKTWRMVVVGDIMQMERLETGSWVPYQTWGA